MEAFMSCVADLKSAILNSVSRYPSKMGVYNLKLVLERFIYLSTKNVEIDILEASSTDLIYILRICATQLMRKTQADSPVNEMCSSYENTLNCVLESLCSLTKSRDVIKDVLPIACSALRIRKLQITAHLSQFVRLSVRDHPQIGSNMAVIPILHALSYNRSMDIMELLFYIQSNYPSAFRRRHSGRLLLSAFSLPDSDTSFRIDCLTLANRILDDLPASDVIVKLCFGSKLNKCLEILLSGGSEETGPLVGEVILKIAQQDLSGMMNGHINAGLARRLPSSWLGCLDVVLSLLVATVHGCVMKKHKHYGNKNCYSICLEAVSSYLETIEQSRNVLKCLLALQDMIMFIPFNLLELHRMRFYTACHHVGLYPSTLWNDLLDRYNQIRSQLERLPTKFDCYEWIHSIEHRLVNFISTMDTSSPAELPITLSSDRRDSTNNQLLSFEEQNFTQQNTFMCTSSRERNSKEKNRDVIEEFNGLGISTPSNALKDECGNQNEQSYDSIASSESELTQRSCDSLSTSTATSASYSPGERHSTVTSQPKLLQHPIPDTFRDKSEWTSSDALCNSGIETNYDSNTCAADRTFPPKLGAGPRQTSFVEPASSAPQLQFLRKPDPVQQFHERYYDKLVAYMKSTMAQLPIPIGIGIWRADSREGARKSEEHVIWLDNTRKNRYGMHLMDYCSPNETSDVLEYLTLYFKCPCRSSNCIYPEDNSGSAFRLVTSNLVVWIQGEPVSSTHPTMCFLRQFWCHIVGMPYTFGTHSLRVSPARGITDRVGDAVTRPTSMYEANREEKSTGGSNSPIQGRTRRWHSFKRSQSRRRLCKVNSFFLLATRAFPNAKECKTIELELMKAGFFELFVRQQIDRSIRSPWICYLCHEQMINSRSRIEMAPLGIHNSIHDRIILQANATAQTQCPISYPSMRGRLQFRYHQRVSCVFSWMLRWRCGYFQLKQGFLIWRLCDDDGMRNTNGCSPNAPFRPAESPDSILNKYRKHGSLDLSTANSSENNRLSFGDVKVLNCVRHVKTGAITELELRTTNRAVLVLRSCQTVRSRCRTESTANVLIQWSRCLQVAMLRYVQMSSDRTIP